MTTTPPASNDLAPLLRHLAAAQTLSQEQAQQAFDIIMDGQATDAQIGAILAALAVRPGGPTVDELTGAARAMRQRVRCVVVPTGMQVVDTCGTGGDHTGTFNISTAAALIAAGAGARIAKHGNRSVTSKSGSSQVLEALGVKLQVPDATLTHCLVEAGLCFCFAPAHHPAMKHVAAARQQLGFRTIFNLLGPLTNPAGAKRQVLGVYDPALTEPLAQVLRELGAVHAMVVHGKTIGSGDVSQGGSGLDEIATTGPTQISELKDGQITTRTLMPEDVGLEMAHIADLRVEGVEESAAAIRAILEGDAGPQRDIACLNAAAALVVAGVSPDLKQGFAAAGESLDTAAARKCLEALVKITNRAI